MTELEAIMKHVTPVDEAVRAETVAVLQGRLDNTTHTNFLLIGYSLHVKEGAEGAEGIESTMGSAGNPIDADKANAANQGSPADWAEYIVSLSLEELTMLLLRSEIENFYNKCVEDAMQCFVEAHTALENGDGNVSVEV